MPNIQDSSICLLSLKLLQLHCVILCWQYWYPKLSSSSISNKTVVLNQNKKFYFKNFFEKKISSLTKSSPFLKTRSYIISSGILKYLVWITTSEPSVTIHCINIYLHHAGQGTILSLHNGLLGPNHSYRVPHPYTMVYCPEFTN